MDLTGAQWHKSLYSGGNGGTCVEVAIVSGSAGVRDRVVAVRDSKNPRGPALIFTPAGWQAFTAAARDGKFDF